MSENLKLRAVSAPWWAGVEFLLQGKDEGGPCVGEVIFHKIAPNVVVVPSFRLGQDEAQTLMDDLWNCGIRPTGGVDNAGQLKATQDHLKDMQQLTYRLLDKALGDK